MSCCCSYCWRAGLSHRRKKWGTVLLDLYVPFGDLVYDKRPLVFPLAQ